MARLRLEVAASHAKWVSDFADGLERLVLKETGRGEAIVLDAPDEFDKEAKSIVTELGRRGIKAEFIPPHTFRLGDWEGTGVS